MKPNPEIPDAVRFALRHVQTSTDEMVLPDDFMAALAGRSTSTEADRALMNFLNEADPAEIADIVGAGAATFETLAAIAQKHLAATHPNLRYLNEFAT